MFGRIVRRYDLLNRLMSLGMDAGWRQVAASAAQPSGGRVLDLGTGTGDLALELRQQGATLVIGADFSPEMLSVAQQKARARNGGQIMWALADALRLPFPDNIFDGVSNAFLLRNLVDLEAGLREMARVKPGGRLVCLDMTRPPSGLFGALYRVYFNCLLPPLTGAISGDRAAYRYLPNSLTDFPEASELASLLADIGLTQVSVRRLAGGTVALHTARKPPLTPPSAAPA